MVGRQRRRYPNAKRHPSPGDRSRERNAPPLLALRPRRAATHTPQTAHDARYPPLAADSRGSGMAVRDRLAREMLDESADLGLEPFHIAAGWLRTVGHWRPKAQKFPNGLSPVAHHAHQKA